MTAFRSLALGLKNGLARPGLLFTLYAVNVAVALPAALVFGNILELGFGNSMATERFLEGFDFIVFQNFLSNAEQAIGAFSQLVSLILFAYVFVNTLLAGGILTVLKEGPSRFSLASFLAGCGRYFWRFVRLFLIYAVLTLVVMVIVGLILGGLFALGTKDADSEVTIVVWAVIVGSIAVTVLGFLLVLLDFAKIVTVQGDLRSMVKATLRSIVFAFRHFFSVTAAIMFVLLLLVAGTAVYFLVTSDLDVTSDLVLIVSFLVQQVYILFRIFLRIAFYECELTLYRHFAAAPEGTAEPLPVPATGP